MYYRWFLYVSWWKLKLLGEIFVYFFCSLNCVLLFHIFPMSLLRFDSDMQRQLTFQWYLNRDLSIALLYYCYFWHNNTLKFGVNIVNPISITTLLGLCQWFLSMDQRLVDCKPLRRFITGTSNHIYSNSNFKMILRPPTIGLQNEC